MFALLALSLVGLGFLFLSRIGPANDAEVRRRHVAEDALRPAEAEGQCRHNNEAFHERCDENCRRKNPTDNCFRICASVLKTDLAWCIQRHGRPSPDTLPIYSRTQH